MKKCKNYKNDKIILFKEHKLGCAQSGVENCFVKENVDFFVHVIDSNNETKVTTNKHKVVQLIKVYVL